MERNTKRVLIIAGEHSGDMHGAKLVAAVRRLIPDIEWFGIGGQCMAEAGVTIHQDLGTMAVMGLSEVLKRLPEFKRIFRSTLELAEMNKPDAVLLIDYPGFNLRFAREAHRMGIRVIYFVCPQVWAWHRSRIKQMAHNVDRLIAIFPFEAGHFKDTGLKVDYVGHPLVDEAAMVREGPDIALPWSGEPRIALLPGSREHEVRRILPAMLAAAKQLESEHPTASFIVATPTLELTEKVRACLSSTRDAPANIKIITAKTRHILRQARAAFVASGTATVEASLMLCPMVIAYRVAPLTYLLGKLLVRVDHIGMVNIIAGKRLCPEFIQGDATPANLAAALSPLLTDDSLHAEMVDGLRAINRRLGEGGAIDRAAASIVDALV